MFLRSESLADTIIINIFLILLWHMLCFIACITCNSSVYSLDKKMFQPKKWEDNGKWYDDKLYIKKWKDRLPQHIGKNGFSKQHFTNLSKEYIDTFIMETCRAEWEHSISCFYIVITFIISPFKIALIFSLFTIAANIPFLIIQRYNRFRLLKIKNRLERAGKY